MTRFSFRRTGVAVAVLFISQQSKPARAYEEDTHFTLTFVQCRLAGLTDAEALTVARFDQGMDDSSGTVANGGLGGAVPNVEEQYLWHAIPMGGTASEILQRKIELWEQVLLEKDKVTALKRLGVFFHYQQDSWAHRKHPSGEATGFTPYRTPLGHALDGHQPDRPPFDPICALRCLEDGIIYARAFVKMSLGRTPSAAFEDYQAAKGELDEAWPDARKNEYFHQLTVDESTEAHARLTGLIRAQIAAYGSSKDKNYDGLKTADELSYDAGRAAFQAVLDARGAGITIPLSREKLTSLTSSQLKPGNLGTQDYQVRIATGDKFGAGTDAAIFLALHGEKGDISEQELNDLIKGNAFERKKTDILTLTGLASIGEITSVTVRSDDTTPASAWFLSWIEVGGPGLTTRRFELNDWIQMGQLTKTIKAK